MTLKRKLILFFTGIHLILMAFAIALLPVSKWLFLAAEGLIIVSIIFSVYIVRIFGRPFRLIGESTQALKASEFSDALKKVGHADLDRLIETYNLMLEKLKQQRIQRQEQALLLEQILESMPVAILVYHSNGTPLRSNPEGNRLLKEKESNWQAEIDQCPPESSRIVSKGSLARFKIRKKSFRQQGKRLWLVIIEELTEEMLRLEKASYNRLVRMMAHEVNNSVAAVNAFMETLHQFSPDIPATYRADFSQSLDTIARRNQDMNRFMQKLADVVRIPEPANTRADLHVLLQKVHTLSYGLLTSKQLQWQCHFNTNSMNVSMDTHLMEQALLNIVKNAIEAAPEGSAIEIFTHKAPALLIIRDHGPGITDKTAGQLFTPFYTTKKQGQGIGLMVVKEILLKHNFKFSLYSHSRGTDFQILFTH